GGGEFSSQFLVDDFFHAMGGSKIGVLKGKTQRIFLIEVRFEFLFDGGAIENFSRGGKLLSLFKTADAHLSLSESVNFLIAALEGGHEESSAGQGRGLSH